MFPYIHSYKIAKACFHETGISLFPCHVNFWSVISPFITCFSYIYSIPIFPCNPSPPLYGHLHFIDLCPLFCGILCYLIHQISRGKELWWGFKQNDALNYLSCKEVHNVKPVICFSIYIEPRTLVCTAGLKATFNKWLDATISVFNNFTLSCAKCIQTQIKFYTPNSFHIFLGHGRRPFGPTNLSKQSHQSYAPLIYL